ncbi:MAG: putative sulfate exporter family transporter [Erysipelotrichaceae bacterium]|nr:putative sulfate exporter family transporter [Erysipelotrichaceae bacterium]
MNSKTKKYLAIALCLLIGWIAQQSTNWQSAGLGRVIMGGPMVALIIGMIICNIVPKIDKDFKTGTTFAAKKFLNWGIILTGATLSFIDILGTGVKALPLIVLNICLAFIVAIFVGKKLNVSENTSILVGAGTSICGGTAIATVAGIIKAAEDEIAFAMAAIFLFDTFAALLFPYLSVALNLTQNQFAFLAGTAINDASSVAGAQATYVALANAGDFNGAINVKLVRTTMLIFVAIAWTLIMAKKNAGAEAKNQSLFAIVKKTFPMFILWFIVMAALNTFGLFSFTVPFAGLTAKKLLGKVAKFLFASALAGVGFKIKFKDVFSKGAKPIMLGGITWLAVAGFAMLFIFVFGGYVA